MAGIPSSMTEFEISGIIRKPIEKTVKCLFTDMECKHFINKEHRCIIFKQKCDLIPKVMWGINQFNELVEMSFITE